MDRQHDSSKSVPAAEPTRQERLERAIQLAGKFASGQKDVSAKHDRHLASAFGHTHASANQNCGRPSITISPGKKNWDTHKRPI